MNKVIDKILIAAGMALAVASLVIFFCMPAIVSIEPHIIKELQSFSGFDILSGASVTQGDSSVQILNSSTASFLPVLFIIVGVVVFGTMSLLDRGKAGRVYKYCAFGLFVVSAIVIFCAQYICVPVKDAALGGEAFSYWFKHSYQLGYGALISGALAFAAGMAFASNLSMEAYKSKKKVLKGI